ncbi:MAG TPA: tripartite tricarboxylate transporter substrate binding protein, partial [Pseudolabrys sp.]|nr:tripartite tricarboxylate transporter substrate binding protein [Pseudolabrys sp.]
MTSRRDLPNRRSVLASIAAAGAFAATGARAQSNWPDHPVRIIVPYPAGGSTDVLSRILAERMKEMFGQPFVIENRPGAGGNIGIAAVTGSPADGYTIGAATIGHFAINQYLYSKMPYDAERDMVPASLTWELPNVFVVASDHCPAKTVSEFISWAKQKGRVSYGSPGVGTSPHLSGVMFVKRTGLDAVHVPFRGAAQTIPAMLAGDVNFAIDNLTSYLPAISSGKM